MAVVCLVLALLCGIGGLIAYVKGWMDGLTNIMIPWTACIIVGLIAYVLSIAAFAAQGA